jgi:hypothetical protein
MEEAKNTLVVATGTVCQIFSFDELIYRVRDKHAIERLGRGELAAHTL